MKAQEQAVSDDQGKKKDTLPKNTSNTVNGERSIVESCSSSDSDESPGGILGIAGGNLSFSQEEVIVWVTFKWFI